MRLSLQAGISATSQDSNRVVGGVVEQVFAATLRRLGIDPWVDVVTTVNGIEVMYSAGFCEWKLNI